jgi:hypothetical protein
VPRAVSLLLISALAAACAPSSPYAGASMIGRFTLRAPTASERARMALDYALAATYAPAIFQETSPGDRPTSWDTPTRVDFDGDLRADNNEEGLRRGVNSVVPAVYYAVLETETHIFVTYSLYHALDWSSAPPIVPFTWHENDMENLQVVVRKASRPDERPAVILLAAQAHLWTSTYAAPGAGVASGARAVSERPLRLVGRSGAGAGTHAAVYVESGGHGIYGAPDRLDAFVSEEPLALREGVLYIPPPPPDRRADGESATESGAATTNTKGRAAAYALLPTFDTFWIPYLDGTGLGDGRLMDGSFDYFYKNGAAWLSVPRHLDSDRLSGPCKADAGILVFAFGYSLDALDLGGLFFSPAETYGESLAIRGPWSTRYLWNPYLPP